MALYGFLKMVTKILCVFFCKLVSFSVFNIVIIINIARPAETEPESLFTFPKCFCCSSNHFPTILTSLGYTPCDITILT